MVMALQLRMLRHPGRNVRKVDAMIDGPLSGMISLMVPSCLINLLMFRSWHGGNVSISAAACEDAMPT